MEEKKQETLEGYVDAIEKQIDKGFIGLVTEITPCTNTVFFGAEKSVYDEKDGYSVTVKIRGDDTEFNQWYSKPKITGWEQSNLHAFKMKYGSIPKKGMDVTCHIDENGFFKITV